MIDNRRTRAALDFHDATKYHALDDTNVGMGPSGEPPIWEEDWSIEPYPYKVYESSAESVVELPREFSGDPDLAGVEALSRTGGELPVSGSSGSGIPDLADLARIAFLSNGLLGRKRRVQSRGSSEGRLIEYRSAGATGARYHLEVYFVCTDLSDLPAGVYHYSALDHSLRALRKGDFRSVLVEATGGSSTIGQAPAVMLVTSTFWRNAWRYKARAYRHAYWDAGTSLSQALAAAASSGLPASVVMAYADRPVDDLLGVDGEREATIALCALGRTTIAPPTAPSVPPLDLPVRPVSAREVTFPDIPKMHAASSLSTGDEAAEWRTYDINRRKTAPRGELFTLQRTAREELGGVPLDELVRSRRSTRRYDQSTPIPFGAFSALLDRSSRGFAADFPELVEQYLIVNAVDGLRPGLYVHHPRLGAVELLREGSFRSSAAHVAADQSYAGDAHVNAYYLADLDRVLAEFGNRGYRAAQLQAALCAGKLHLAAHALGLGACGSTSYDDEVVELFSPHAAGKAYLFVTVFGVPLRKNATQ